MSRTPVLRKSMRDYQGASLGVAVTATLIAILDLAIYPSYSRQLKDFQMPDAFKAFLGEAGSIATPTGFITSEYFSWVPLMIIVLAIIAGTGTLAGEEAAGTLEFLLAQPVSRLRLLLNKAAGLTILVIVATLLPYPVMLVGMTLSDFELSRVKLLEAMIGTIPLELLFLYLSLWCSAVLPTRSAASLTAGGVVVVTYFLNSVGALVGVLDTPRKFTPFYWSDASHVLVKGFDPLRFIAVLAVALVFLALAAVAFQRREVSAGGKELRLPWRRKPVENGASEPV